MRLINTKSLELDEFFDRKIPPYVILSHRWEQDKVSYQDYIEGKKRKGARYAKILNFGKMAMHDGHEWGWVDTCCIDKKSSVELSEAINAMYSWYKESQRCYVHLSDVEMAKGLTPKRLWPAFERSKWFTRGWTLQELMAPRILVFYDHQWHRIARRSALLKSITVVTNIPSAAFYNLSDYSAAQKFSWASKRETSRVEDMACCLMGLFGVNMPLLYGEGAAAFQRLQQEIMKLSSDETLFVWGRNIQDGGAEAFKIARSFLAPDPGGFLRCGDVRSHHFFWRKPYSMTNQGLKLSTSLYVETATKAVSKAVSINSYHYLIPLNCDEYFESDGQQPDFVTVQLGLEICVSMDKSEAYCWIGWREMPEGAEKIADTKTIYIRLL